MRNLPHHAFEHNQTWLETSLIAQDLLTWTKLICLDGELASAGAHTPAPAGAATHLKLDRDWPWSDALAAAFQRMRTIPALG